MQTGTWIATAVCQPDPHRQYVFTIPQILRSLFRTRLHLPQDTEGRRRLAEYLLRAPFSLQKMTWNPDTKTVIYRSRRSWHTKRNFEVFKATDFLAAAIEHIPPKGQQVIRYYGLYSNKTRGLTRPTAAVIPPPPENPAPDKPPPEILPAPPKPSARAMRPLWRDLILRVWGTDPLRCPCCQGTMRRIETILRPEEIEKRRRLVGVLDRNPCSG